MRRSCSGESGPVEAALDVVPPTSAPRASGRAAARVTLETAGSKAKESSTEASEDSGCGAPVACGACRPGHPQELDEHETAHRRAPAADADHGEDGTVRSVTRAYCLRYRRAHHLERADVTNVPPSATAPALDPANAYRQPAAAVAAALDVDPRRGLTETEARARLARHGRNELEAAPPVPAWRRFLAQFQDVLVLLLLAATVISAALWVYERDTALPYESFAILAVVLLNAAMGYVQEAKAEA